MFTASRVLSFDSPMWTLCHPRPQLRLGHFYVYNQATVPTPESAHPLFTWGNPKSQPKVLTPEINISRRHSKGLATQAVKTVCPATVASGPSWEARIYVFCFCPICQTLRWFYLDSFQGVRSARNTSSIMLPSALLDSGTLSKTSDSTLESTGIAAKPGSDIWWKERTATSIQTEV